MSWQMRALCSFFLVACGGSPRPTVVHPAEQAEVEGDLRAFVRYALEPARIAPPTVTWEPREIEVDGVRARITPLRPEEAGWNRWSRGEARLFNNRMAYLFLVRVEGPGPLAWSPRESTLELNGPMNRLVAAGAPDELLSEITFWAVLQERLLLEGDLADRIRGAGPFRASYLPLHSSDSVLEGVIGFPLGLERGAALSELHVATLRLTLRIQAGDRPRELVWVFR